MGAWGVGLLDNDAAVDFLLECKQNGLPLVKSAVRELMRIARRNALERDDANIALVISAILLAKRGKLLREAQRTRHFQEAVAACRGRIGKSDLRAVEWLVEQIIKKSELRELYEEAGLLNKWLSKMRYVHRLARTLLK